jgi:hypothetical protein
MSMVYGREEWFLFCILVSGKESLLSTAPLSTKAKGREKSRIRNVRLSERVGRGERGYSAKGPEANDCCLCQFAGAAACGRCTTTLKGPLRRRAMSDERSGGRAGARDKLKCAGAGPDSGGWQGGRIRRPIRSLTDPEERSRPNVIALLVDVLVWRMERAKGRGEES